MSNSCLPITKNLSFFCLDPRTICIRLVDIDKLTPVNISEYVTATFVLKNRPSIGVDTDVELTGAISYDSGWVKFIFNTNKLKEIWTGNESKEYIELYGSIYLMNSKGDRLSYLKGLHSFEGGPQND